MQLYLSRNVEDNKKNLYNSIKEKLEKKQTVYLIVPEQFTLGTEIEAFDMLDLQATLNLKIKSFTKLVSDIVLANGGRNINFISDQAKYLLVQSILLDMKSELRVFQDNVFDREFIDLLIRLMDEISDNGFDMEDLDKISMDPATSQELALKLQDIKEIGKRYLKAIKESGYVDLERIDIAIDKISSMDKYSDAYFYFYRYHDMSNKELELVSKIDKIAKKTYMNITLDKDLLDPRVDSRSIKDGDIFDISLNLYHRLKNFIEGDLDIVDKHQKLAYTNIEMLVNNMFRYDGNKVKEDFKNQKVKDIYIQRSNNTNEEIENLSIEIKKDIIDHGLDYRDIAILATNSEEYFPKIKRNFDINDIPFFLDESRKILDNAIIKYIKAGFTLLQTGLNSQTIIQYLKSSFLQVDSQTIGHMQTFLEKRKMHGSMIFNDKYFQIQDDQRYSEEDRENLKAIEEVRKTFIDLLNVDGENIFDYLQDHAKASFSDYAQLIYKFFANYIVMHSYQKYEENLSEEKLEENKGIWSAFIDLINNLYLMQQVQVTFDRFVEITISAIDNFKVGIIPPSQDQVVVGTIKRSRFNKIKKLYVLGMSNLYYPPANVDIDILTEEEKESLKILDLNLRNTQKNHNANDLLSFYEILNSASEQIVFSYALVNSSNEAMEKAYIMNLIESMIYQSNDHKVNLKFDDFIYVRSKLNEYIPKMVRGEDSHQIGDLEKIFYKKLNESILLRPDKYRSILHTIDIYKRLDLPRKLDRSLVNKIYRLDKFSVSQLEAFNSNPYNHFVKYGLKPREEDSFEISNLETGNIFHGFMESYLKESEVNENVDAKEIFQETVDDLVPDYKTEDMKNRFFISQMKDNSDIYAKVIKEQIDLSPISSIDMEIKYGKDSKFKPVEIKLENGESIFIEGKIDRVDQISYQGYNYYRVIDYKTGGKKFEIGKVYLGIDLQLMLYLQSVVESDDQGKPFGAFYQKLNEQYLLLEPSMYVEAKDQGLFDSMKLTGVINSDPSLFDFSDKSSDANNPKNSSIFKFDGRKKSFIDKDNVLSEDMFKNLFKLNVNNIKTTIEQISDGNIDLKPYRIGNVTTYDYSPYKTIDKSEGLEIVRIDNYNWEFVKERLSIDKYKEEEE